MSCKIIQPAKNRTIHLNLIEFEHRDGKNKGWYSFEADKEWNVTYDDGDIGKMQKESFQRCVNDPDMAGPFKRMEVRKYRDDAKAICECGKDIELWNQYLGACSCPGCGRWHNLFGQTLVDPEYWESDYEY